MPFCILFQIRILLTTCLTSKWFFPCMNALMIVQCGQFFKSSITFSAYMWLLITVVQQMLVVGLLECKGFATSVTTIWSLTSVKTLVLLKEVFCCEQFGTHVTFPLFAFMCLQVLQQMLLLECHYIFI